MDAKKILVVDDEPDTIVYVTAVLEDNAYQVSSAHNAEKGMELLEKDPPDLIIVDVMMPGASGLDFIQQIRRHPLHSDLPVLVVTGKGEILKNKCRSFLECSGVRPPDEILEKPFDPKDLIKAIDALS